MPQTKKSSHLYEISFCKDRVHENCHFYVPFSHGKISSAVLTKTANLEGIFYRCEFNEECELGKWQVSWLFKFENSRKINSFKTVCQIYILLDLSRRIKWKVYMHIRQSLKFEKTGFRPFQNWKILDMLNPDIYSFYKSR